MKKIPIVLLLLINAQFIFGSHKTIFCPKISEKPIIDGQLNDSCWKKTIWQTGFYNLNSKAFCKVQTETALFIDEDNLYIAVKSNTQNTKMLKSKYLNRDNDGIYTDESIEIFLRTHANEKIFFQFIVNSAGTIYDSMSNTNSRSWNSRIEAAASILEKSGRRGYWYLEIKIPLKDIHLTNSDLRYWSINFIRNNKQRGHASSFVKLKESEYQATRKYARFHFRMPNQQELQNIKNIYKSILPNTNEVSAISFNNTKGLEIKKLLLTDARVLRAFVGDVIDNYNKSYNHDGIYEYPRKWVGPGISYKYNNMDGLHLDMNEKAFNLVVLEGGANTKMYKNSSSLYHAKKATLLHHFNGNEDLSIFRFKNDIKAKKVNFFETANGSISNLSFYQIKNKKPISDGEILYINDKSYQLKQPKSPYDTSKIYNAMIKQYGEIENRIQLLQQKPDAKSKTWPIEKNTLYHFISEPKPNKMAFKAISFHTEITDIKKPCILSLDIADPLSPSRSILKLRFKIIKPQKIHLTFDIPHQILLPGSQIWIKFEMDQKVILRYNSTYFKIHQIPVAKALPEAIIQRKFIMRILFSALSEANTWNLLHKYKDNEAFYQNTRFGKMYAELFKTIEQCKELDPKDDLVRQYDEWVFARRIKHFSEIERPAPAPKHIPEWAWYHRMAWHELRRIIQWWIDERLVPNGELGGGPGDDSDFFQQIIDLPFFTDLDFETKLKSVATALSETLEKHHLQYGLNKSTTDALHAYEEGLNHRALMARWFYGDPIYMERCMETARNLEKLTIKTNHTQRFFRDSDKMGATDVDIPRQPRIDSSISTLMWHPSLEVADYNRNPRIMKVMKEWADSWLSTMKIGQWTTAITVPSGKVASFNKKNPMIGGYWSQAAFFTWFTKLTGNLKYIWPPMHYIKKGAITYPFNFFIQDFNSLDAFSHLDENVKNTFKEKNNLFKIYLSEDLKMDMEFLIGANNRGNSSPAINTLWEAKRWPDMYTHSNVFTDRVLQGNFSIWSSIAYLGGAMRRNKFNPHHAIKWEGLGKNFAALVLKNSNHFIKVALYNFNTMPISGYMRLTNIEHGHYHIQQGIDENQNLSINQYKSSTKLELLRYDKIRLTLEPNKVHIVEIKQLKKLKPIYQRADLAISPRETKIHKGTLTGTVHNIGSTSAKSFVVALINGKGEIVTKKKIASLDAPLDLWPRKLKFNFKLPKHYSKKWSIAIDPNDQIPEIYEGNNNVKFEHCMSI